MAFLFLMVVAGNETTTKLLGNAWYWGWRNPDQRATPFADPSAVVAWAEETLRYDTSSQMLLRVTRQPVHLHGTTVAEGDVVALLWDVTVNRANCSGIYIREITDSTGVVRVYAAKPATFVSLPIGRYTTHSANPLVVPNVSLGPATLTIRYETWCNWFQKLFPIVSTTQASFVVYPAKKPVDAGSDATVK